MAHQWTGANGMSGYGSLRAETRQMTAPTKGIDISNYHSTGNVGSSMSPLKERIEHLKDFFGHPSKNVDQLQNEYDNSHRYGDVEYEDYPEAFKAFEGKNNYLQRVMIEKIKASENYQLTRMAPWFLTDSMKFEWNEARFHKHMLDREPEESVPRMTSHTYRNGSASMVRYGICLMLERNFYLTPKGQQTYLFNIEQLRIAAVETCSHGVMVAVLEHEPCEDWNDRYMNKNTRSKLDLDDLFKHETGEFAVIHKSKDGYKSLKSKMMSILSERCNGESGDFTILPQGMLEFTKESIDEGKYYLDGGKGTGMGITINNASVAQSRGFSYGEHTVAVDPFFRNTTIGGFGTLSDENARGEIENYRTSHMNCSIYDESMDKFQALRYSDIYKNAGLWDFRKAGMPLTDIIGKGYTSDWHCYTYGQLLRKDNNMQRAVDKLLWIKDEGVRSEFISSLRILPKDDERVQRIGPPPPGTFRQDLFDGMFDSSLSWDKTFSKTYSMKQQADIEARKRTHSGLGNQELEDESRLYEEEKHRQARGPAVNKRPRTMDASVFYGESMEDIPVAPGSSASGRVTQVSPGAYTYQPANNGLKRFKHAPINQFDRMDVQSDPTVFSMLETIVDSAQKFIPAGTDTIDAVEIEIDGRTRKVSAVTKFAFESSNRMLQLEGLTTVQQINTLAELNRVVCNEAMKRGSTPTSVDAAAMIVLPNFIPFFSKVEARAILSSSTSAPTPLEVEYAANPECDIVSSKTTSGAWKPDAAVVSVNGAQAYDPDSLDDGQLELMFSPLFNSGLPLAHDSMAATLCGAHQVIFCSAGMNPNNSPMMITQGMKRSRIDALAWSVALSYLMYSFVLEFSAVVDLAIAGDVQRAMASTITNIGSFGDSAFRARLSRISPVASLFPLLPSQAHLTGIVRALSVVLVDTLKNPNHVHQTNDLVNAWIQFTTRFVAVDENSFKTVIRRGYIVPIQASASTSPVDAIAAQQIENYAVKNNIVLGSFGTSLAKRAAKAIISGIPVSTVTYPQAQLEFMLDTWWNHGGAKIEYQGVSDIDDHWDKVKTVLSFLYDTTRGRNRVVYGVKDLSVPLQQSDPATEATPSWTAAGLAYLIDHASLVSGGYYKFCIDRDIPVPFFIRYWRPSKTYNMGCVVHMCSGEGGAARTAYKNPDFMLAENAAQKMLFGHFTMYNTTFITAPEKIVIAKNVFSKGYRGGNDMNIWNPLSMAHGAAYRNGQMEVASMFITLGLMNQCTPYASWLSMSGVMPASLNVDNSVAKGVAYPGCAGFSSFWGVRAGGEDGLVQTSRNKYSTAPNQLERKFNVICMQEVQLDIYNAANPNKPIVHMDKGHWGPNVYSGCSAVREGRKMHFDTPEYFDIKAFTLK